MKPTRKQPLFIITGASCAGKSTVCEELFKTESDYIVMESDLLWEERFNTPENHYYDYRRLWLRVCANIAQIGKPVVLCGCATPEQFEYLPERELFTDIHYLAVVCTDEVLDRRMRIGRKVTDDAWIQSSVHFNHWLQENGARCVPGIELLDTSALTPQEGAERLDRWIRARI